MQSPQPQPKVHAQEQQTQQKTASKPNEKGHILVQDHFSIRDRADDQVLVKGRG